MQAPHPWVDVSRYPIVVVEFAAVSNVNDFRALTFALRRFAADLHEPIALVTDLSKIRSGDPESRNVYAEFVRDMRGPSGRWVRATAVITPNPIQRTIMNLHTLLVGKTPYPVRAFGTRDEAIPWVRARLSALHC